MEARLAESEVNNRRQHSCSHSVVLPYARPISLTVSLTIQAAPSSPAVVPDDSEEVGAKKKLEEEKALERAEQTRVKQREAEESAAKAAKKAAALAAEKEKAGALAAEKEKEKADALAAEKEKAKADALAAEKEKSKAGTIDSLVVEEDAVDYEDEVEEQQQDASVSKKRKAGVA